MPKQPAKETFSRQEIHEILRRNVELYRSDPGFVEYFTELTLYLMGKSEQGEVLAPNETPLPMDYLKRPDPKPAPLSPPESGSRPATPPPLEEEPSSRRLARSPYLPPAPPPSLDDVPLPSGVSRDKTPPPFHPQAPHPSSSEKRDRTPTVNVERAPLQTPHPPPPPPAGETSSRRLIPPSRPAQGDKDASDRDPAVKGSPVSGRTQVYRVVRPYKSPTSLEVPCKSCGTMIPHEAQYCPGCGEPRSR